MFSLQKLQTRLYPACMRSPYKTHTEKYDHFHYSICRMSELGKASSVGGSIREAGGSLGEMGAVHEDDYFFKEQKKSLENLRLDQYEQTHFHEQAIKEHNYAIKRHKKLLTDPSHSDRVASHQDAITRHEQAIKGHQVFLKNVQI